MKHKRMKKIVASLLILSFLVTSYGNIGAVKANGGTKVKVPGRTW